MIKWFSDIIATIVFFLVYMIIYYIFAKTVNISLIACTIVFFILLLMYDVIKYED